MKLSSVVFSIVLASSATFANAANLVTNGSFETPVVTSSSHWAPEASVPGWVNATESTIEIQTTALGYITAADGNQYMELNCNLPSYVHTTALATVAGDKYTFSFAYAGRSDGGANTMNVLWDGNVIQAALQAPSTSAWTYYSYTVTAQGNDTAGFSSVPYQTGALSYGNFIDKVSVTPTPLPAALFFVAPALAGVFGFSRRKAANGLQA